MFSARLGFMRPDSVTEPDGPVVPPDDPTVAGNMWFSTRQNVSHLQSYSKYSGHEFNNLITDNWMIVTMVMPPNNQPSGFVRYNGLDQSEFTNIPNSSVNIPKNQPILNKFCLGAFERNDAKTTGNQMGAPMIIRDFYIDNGVTSLSDVHKIEGWMCHEAGLQDILQSDHPYRSSTPGGFTPSNLSPRAWWHSETNFDPAGTATWQTWDGAHTLTKDTSPNVSNNETIQGVTEDGIIAIKFVNSKPTKSIPPFYGSKYRADSVALNSNIHSQGLTICALIKFYDMPNVYDQDTVPYANTSWFTFNNEDSQDSYINGGFRPEIETLTRPTSINADTTDSTPDSGNTDVNVANVTTDGGNVSV